MIICWEDIIDKSFCFNFKGNTFSNSKDNILSFQAEAFFACIIDNINTSKIEGVQNFVIKIQEEESDDEEGNTNKKKRKSQTKVKNKKIQKK